MKINIKREVLDFGFQNIQFVDGLTLDKVKTKYNWLLNARIKDAIIGESDDNKLNWYCGEWLCGEWFDGNWYSGVFHSGIWRFGNFYSYDLNLPELSNNKFIINDISNDYSHFLTGNWLDGTFNNGTFGINEEYWDNQSKYDIDCSTLKPYNIDWETEISNCVWETGIFKDGLFINSLWETGDFLNGSMSKSWWKYGYFYNGSFEDHTWEDGKWYGGDFLQGNWLDGTFSQINKSASRLSLSSVSSIVKSRFGVNKSDKIVSRWYNGEFLSGEFHSGLNVMSGITYPCTSHISTRWYNGTFKNGTWYGGQFEQGDWLNGKWENGIWGTWVNENWYYPTSIISSSTGDTYWEDLNNLTGYTEDYAYLETTGTSFATSGWTNSDYLQFSGWQDLSGNSFNIPSSDVTGMQIKVERSAHYHITLGGTTDNIVKMYNNDLSISGSNYATIDDYFTQDKQLLYYGNYDNNWTDDTGVTPWSSGLTTTLINDDDLYLIYGTSNYKYEYLSPTFDMYAKLYNIGLRIFYNTSPTWYDGIWNNGLWINGTFKNGYFNHGEWLNGTFENGTFGV